MYNFYEFFSFYLLSLSKKSLENIYSRRIRQNAELTKTEFSEQHTQPIKFEETHCISLKYDLLKYDRTPLNLKI